MNGLLTDLYELTMAAGFFETGKYQETATFEFSIRRLPRHRNFVIIAGLPQVVDYLLNLSFEAEEIDYLRGLPQFARASDGFWNYLRGFRFTGDLFAVPEGTVLFSGEPVLAIRAPIIEAQIPETYVLAAIAFPTLIASKAARCVEAAQGRAVVEFGTRRAHTAEAGVLGGRAAYIGGSIGTSNTLTGFRYGIPVYGTAAHSWVMSFTGELESYRHLQKLLGPQTVHLVDTYDVVEGTRKAASLGEPLWGIRIDSGDFIDLSRRARGILDQAGLRDAKIMLSGDLDESRIVELLNKGASVDAFGVGTQLATSGDAPSLSAVYKLVELDIRGIKRHTAKYSAEKHTLPGAKQIFRMEDRDILARSGECGRGEPLLRPIMIGGSLIEPLPDAAEARRRASESLSRLPAKYRALDVTDPYPVERSEELELLVEQTRSSCDVRSPLPG
jgi:nicotinate phosphoribosyltransferase